MLLSVWRFETDLMSQHPSQCLVGATKYNTRQSLILHLLLHSAGRRCGCPDLNRFLVSLFLLSWLLLVCRSDPQHLHDPFHDLAKPEEVQQNQYYGKHDHCGMGEGRGTQNVDQMYSQHCKVWKFEGIQGSKVRDPTCWTDLAFLVPGQGAKLCWVVWTFSRMCGLFERLWTAQTKECLNLCAVQLLETDETALLASLSQTSRYPERYLSREQVT